LGGVELRNLDVSCIVLAGGKSTRLGRNKVAEKVGNRSLLERVISCLAPLDSEIIVVTAEESIIPELTRLSTIKVVKDIFPGKGSLGGVFTGLTLSENIFNLVVAGDMPFLNLRLLKYLISLAEKDGADVVIPRVNDDILEPLHAVYSKKCLPTMERLISENRLSILELFPLVKVRYVAEDELNALDANHLSFFNINTEADLRKGKELAGKEDCGDDKC
jgi:molybdopterin-guanine dinucleotide biosynthesis protein A